MGKDDVMLVTPSDHFIKNEAAYSKLINAGQSLAKEGQLVTFGIKPTYAATGYGYIEAENGKVINFKEKPDEATASVYVKKGNFFWNSGMFMFKAGTFLSELQQYAPEILSAAKLAYERRIVEPTLGTTRISLEDMNNIPANSIDYAVMEHSKNISVIQGEIGWSDLGSFDELYEAFDKDSDGNAIHGQATCLESNNNLIFSRENKMIATLGVSDLLIIDTGDALLVTQKGQSQAVKTLVQALNQDNSELTKTHRTVHRPWGTYEVLLEEPSSRYKLKKIVVKPKHKLSAQKHFHRNEHWIVVSGTAKIQNGEETFLLRENESTYIPMGQIHRLENPGKIELVMIEAQVGSYLGEDDIVRLEDDFNRK
jgi:mannose-1-phosphate guanylyltransferase